MLDCHSLGRVAAQAVEDRHGPRIGARVTAIIGFRCARPDEADPLKGPTDVGTAREKEADVALSTLVGKLNERFGTDFTEADQLFFDSVRATAERDEKIVEAAKANTEANFSHFSTGFLMTCSSSGWKAMTKSSTA